MTYHEKMCALAADHYENHELFRTPEHAELGVSAYNPPWRIKDDAAIWTSAVEIRPLAFGRLLVHGSCEPIVFGNYSQEEHRWHPIIHLIGERDAKYLDYVVGKTIPRMPDYYDHDQAHVDLVKLRKEVENGDVGTDTGAGEDELIILEEAIDSDYWPEMHRVLYEHFLTDGEGIVQFGRVLAPPNFYYAVFAVKKLWELLEDA